jgi:mycothiol synthase
MTLPAGYRFRPLREEEADAVTTLFNEEGRALTGEIILPPDWTRTWWRQPDVVHETDMVVVEAPDGTLAGAFLLRREPPGVEIWGTGGVGPAHHGKGIGSAILRASEATVRRSPAVEVFRSGTLDVPAAHELFEAHGFRLARRFLTMRIEFGRPPPGPDPVAGVHVGGYDAGRDGEAVFDVMQAAFRDHWGDTEWTRESWRTGYEERYDHGLWWLAWRGGELAGALIGTAEAYDRKTGIIELLGVAPRHRRHGVGELLLRTAFRAFHQRGLSAVELTVDAESETGATRLYERVGTLSRPRFCVYEKELRREPTATV